MTYRVPTPYGWVAEEDYITMKTFIDNHYHLIPINGNEKTLFGLRTQHPHEVIRDGEVLFVGERGKAVLLAMKFNGISRVKLRTVRGV